MVDVVIKDMQDMNLLDFGDNLKKPKSDIAAFRVDYTPRHQPDYDRNHRRKRPTVEPETPEKKRKKANYSIGPDNYGPRLAYKNQEQLDQFINGSLTKQDTLYNGITWRYCSKCQRMGNHSTERHRDRTPRTAESNRAPAAPLAPVAQMAAAAPPPVLDLDDASDVSGRTYYGDDDSQ